MAPAIGKGSFSQSIRTPVSSARAFASIRRRAGRPRAISTSPVAVPPKVEASIELKVKTPGRYSTCARARSAEKISTTAPWTSTSPVMDKGSGPRVNSTVPRSRPPRSGKVACM